MAPSKRRASNIPGQDARATRAALRRIALLVLDVDGVMTDGRILLDADGREIKGFNTLDGAGIKYWQRAGREIAIISGRSSTAVLHRANELGVTLVRQGAKDKLPAYLAILAQLKLKPAQVAVMGDDLPDLPLLLRCGLPIAVPNACPEVLAAAAHVTRLPGGAGAVRAAVEHILRGAGLWDQILARYYRGTGGRP